MSRLGGSLLLPCRDSRMPMAQTSGELFFFANDVWFMYWNNHGEIEVNVYELDPTATPKTLTT